MKMEKMLLHSVRVARYAVRVLNNHSEKNNHYNFLYMAGLFHDIGKIHIPFSILNKKDKLTEEEFRIIQLHPKIGARLLKNLNYCSEIIEAVLYHHERWDGYGYPCGLQGKEIPFYSRILSVADAFEAMTSERPYKKALPQNLALEELRANAGTQFDPDIVRIFLEKDLLGPELPEDDFCSKEKGHMVTDAITEKLLCYNITSSQSSTE